ncbi:ArsR family transcriptional regulator [Rhodomicrobium udaipurense JA643]|uniref:Helix-turn-helix transcriptional regulator n=1 Tax=Rhodomicrobium udaipurense TaxID=1202716 RepID=A0A8I1KKG2_9HYPH|nr:metalloregulator ArsR/SmtB family transcription factor [Rhodomicrobium udaipurense]KAI94236.1 ArsR family transcriptional regulator [Rhodomicrobium udaipurense JA643]MBJ7544029.1 helix-turn-helix transcriptional regulator [Rhodomicrobium udaipurense]
MTSEDATIPVDLGIKSEERADGPPKLDDMVRNARLATDFLKALSHETRLLLLCLLSEGERSVTDLENSLSLRQPTISQQLARLRLDGLVTTRRDGKTVYYSIADDDIKRVIALLYEIFCKGPGQERKSPRDWRE